MKQKIIKIANLLGIEIIGFTSILDYSYLSDFLYDRSKNGYSCEFEEQDINKRLNVSSVFPNCKSIIAIGVPYAVGFKRPTTKDRGLLSIVSYGEDYHKQLRLILENLADEIKKLVDFEYEICVDTSPLIDREICKNAGIGSYGKNALLINENYGSFINIGYLLTDLKIDCTNSINNINICGDCDICIKVCPNNAILKDGGINAKKCISYLTQTKDYIPLEYRENMKNQIYGCDVCQALCPKNKTNAEKTNNINYNSLLIDLEDMFEISNKEFEAKYGYLSGSWRGKNVWKRNALIAIGNLGLISMFDKVKRELNNESDMIKIYAAWSLMKLDKEMATKILHNSMKYENDTIKKEYMRLVEAEYDSWNVRN